MAVPFISATDLNNYLGRTVDTDKSAIAVDAACDIVCKAVDQTLYYTEDDVVVLDSDGTDTLMLPELPVYEVSSVVGPLGTSMEEGTDYWLDKESGSLHTPSRYYTFNFLKGRQLYTITYTHGFVSDAAAPGLPSNVQEWPSSVRMVALQLATRIYDQGIVAQESFAGLAMTYSAPESIALTPSEKEILALAVGVGRRK